MSKLLDLLKRHEGTGPVHNGNFMPYHDSEGLLTIGYGICIDRTGITKDEAEYLLETRLTDVEELCIREFEWFKSMSEERQAVIISMVYNLGLVGFKGFRNTIRYLAGRNYVMASTEMLDSKWSKQVGDRAKELSKMMRTGKWL